MTTRARSILGGLLVSIPIILVGGTFFAFPIVAFVIDRMDVGGELVWINVVISLLAGIGFIGLFTAFPVGIYLLVRNEQKQRS